MKTPTFALAVLLLCAASAGAEPRFSFDSTPGKLPKEKALLLEAMPKKPG